MLSVSFWIFNQKPVESILSLFLVSSLIEFNVLIECLCAICNKPSAIYVSRVFKHAAPLFSRFLQ